MSTNRQNRSSKHNPWSWHRIFLLFALTIIMILGFVVVGSGYAMMSKCQEPHTRRSVYLSDIVTKTKTKRDLLDRLMTAWQCDIPVKRLSPALAAVSGDLPRPCDSDLLSQLRLGAQGALGAGVLLVVASAGGYGGAISARSGPLALYIVVTVVTVVLELTAVGLLVHQKSQLDGLPDRLELLMAQPVVELEVETVVLDAPGGILTAPGEVPTPASLPSGRRAGSEDSGGRTAQIRTTGMTSYTGTVAGSEVTDSPGGAVGSTTERTQKTPGAAVDSEAISTAPPGPQPSPIPVPTKPPVTPSDTIDAGTPAVEAEDGTQAPVNTNPLPKNVPTALSASPSTSPPKPSSSPVLDPESITNGTEDPAEPKPGHPVPRRRRRSGRDRQEPDEDPTDHTEVVIAHWAPAASACLLHGDQANRSHCYTQLEHNLQRELTQSELVLELMMAPLVCAFLACLLQLTTLCAAWNMISDQQSHRPRPPIAPDQLSTPV